jgi:hypothetical protein
MSTAQLAVTDRTRPGSDRDDVHNPCIRIVGASRPSAVRALLTRSITMTALSIERRIRTLRRRPNTDAPSLPKLVAWHERQADRAGQDLELAKATSIWSLSIR